MNQTKLGEALGVTFQQVQKYENGANRISASRLYQIGRVLDVPVPYFFEDLPESGKSAQRRPTGSKAPPTKQDPMTRSETLKLVRAYYRIEDADVRQCLRDTVTALANEGRRRHA
jgi:transcriptional regulator with XRE-family HTH domain